MGLKNASTTVTINVAAPREWFFYRFFAIDVPGVMHRYGIVPGVVDVTDQTGPMHLVGSSRVIHFDDGGTAFEEILDSNPPHQVRYRLYKMTNLFRFLVREGRAHVIHTEDQLGGTKVEYSYAFYGHNWLATLVLKPLVAIFMKGYLGKALERIKQIAETEIQEKLP